MRTCYFSPLAFIPLFVKAEKGPKPGSSVLERPSSKLVQIAPARWFHFATTVHSEEQ
jgi:hypothetical protein